MNILQEADKVVNQRQQAYDKPEDNFQRIADLWNGYSKAKGWGIEFKSQDIAALMIQVKVGREIWRHKKDNLIDMAGYAQCWENLEDHEQTG